MERKVGREIRDIHILTERYITKHLKNKEKQLLTPIQIDIMGYLAGINQKVCQKNIEKEFHLRKSTISGILRTMQKNGVIDKVEDKNDFRSKQIKLTKTGYETYRELITEIKKMENLLEKDIEKLELETFFKVVDKIKENLKES